MLFQMVSEGRLVKMSWSVGTAGGGRAGLAVAASFPPEAPAACSVSEGGGDLDRDLKGFHAALEEAAAGAGPLSAGPLPSAFSSGVSLVATGDCTKARNIILFLPFHTCKTVTMLQPVHTGITSVHSDWTLLLAMLMKICQLAHNVIRHLPLALRKIATNQHIQRTFQ